MHGPNTSVKSPGKQPKLSKWQKLEIPFSDGEIENKYSNDENLGFICGKKSDLTVLDIDWYVKGIWSEILKDIDTSNWVKQAHTGMKWHYLFRYFNDIKAKTYPGLGFDVLSDTLQKDSEIGVQYTGGNNCVAAAFMDECTETGKEDIDAVKLYSTYTLWVNYYGKNKIAYNQ